MRSAVPGHVGLRAADPGETLIELLVTIVIVGIGVTAVLGAIRMGIEASGQTKAHNKVMAALRTYGEALTDTGDTGNTGYSTIRQYVGCRTLASYRTTGSAGSPGLPALGVTAPAGITLDVTSVQYWTGTAYSATCPTADLGLQKVRLSATGSNGGYPQVTGSLEVYVRRPCTTASGTPGAC